jgi:S-adenosylmethionine hydrolase
LARIITFTTDWSNSDYYIGAVKAAILSKCSDVNFIDISHNIEHFSIYQAAFVLKSVYKNFPQATIHIIGVDSEPDKDGYILVAKYDSQYFISSNNACTGFIFEKEPEIAVLVNTGFAFEGASFIDLNIFSQIAAYIAKGGDITKLGESITEVKRKLSINCQIEPDFINGEVIYIDSYQNAITNISREIFDQYIGNQDFEILINTNRIKVSEIKMSYKEVESGEIVCIFNSLGLLEIAIREGKAAQLLNLGIRSEIRVKY